MQSQMAESLRIVTDQEYEAQKRVGRDPSRRNMDDLEGLQRAKRLYQRRMAGMEDDE
jgi:hypothetical protein